jgi:Ca2+-binding EF-hand superfamily protein
MQAQTSGELESYQRRLERLFERLDRNGDRRLSPSEVQGRPYLQRHFQRLDRQGRGYLVPGDLTPANAAAHGERARQFFTTVDRNGNGVIDRQEADGYPWLERRFNAMDSNGDGGISREELMNLRRRQAGDS